MKLKLYSIGKDSESHGVTPPIPSKKVVPDWYKSSPRFTNNSKSLTVNSMGGTNVTYKTCVPYLDSLTMGYVVTTWCELLVEKDPETGEKIIRWTSKLSPIEARDLESLEGMPQYPGFDKMTQAFKFKWAIETPKGYSLLITQPMNRPDLVTYCPSGIIDAESLVPAGGIPFAIRSDFEGIIPSGTPIMQIIPFKRDSWKLELNDKTYKEEDIFKVSNSIINTMTGFYKKNMWKKKDFE